MDEEGARRQIARGEELVGFYGKKSRRKATWAGSAQDLEEAMKILKRKLGD